MLTPVVRRNSSWKNLQFSPSPTGTFPISSRLFNTPNFESTRQASSAWWILVLALFVAQLIIVLNPEQEEGKASRSQRQVQSICQLSPVILFDPVYTIRKHYSREAFSPEQ
jgi:hypothetical protein